MSRVIGIVSLKGGVGKTSVVVSLGSALGLLGKRVLLVDANLSAPNLGVHLNLIDPKITLHHVLQKDAHVADAIHHLEHFDVLPASMFSSGNINPLKLKDKLKPLRALYDVILVDSSPSFTQETLAATLLADELLIVTTPDLPTLSMTLKAVKFANQRRIPIDGIILNKVHGKSFELSIDDIEKTAEVPVLAIVPFDLSIPKALSKFTNAVQSNASSVGSREFRKLASTLVGSKFQPTYVQDYFSLVPSRSDINREIFYETIFGKE